LDNEWQLFNCYAVLASLYLETERPGEAAQAYRLQLVTLEKIAANGTAPDLVDADCYFCLRRGECHNALAHCLRSIERDREAAEEYRKAVEQYRRGLAMSPRASRIKVLSTLYSAKGVNSELLNNQAWLLATCPYTEVREPAQAVELGTKALASVPGERNYWNTLGVAHYRAGHWSDALAALEKAVQLGNGGAHDWFFLAMAHWQLGDKEQGRDWYDKAVAWMENNKRAIERDWVLNDELPRFRAEAAALLRTKEAPADENKAPTTKP
jgi:tetratricopeptide (TPR) repeat protein